MRINFNGEFSLVLQVGAPVILLKSTYFHYIKFCQKSTKSNRDKNVAILDRKIMGLKDRANFGSLKFINTNKITRLSLKEGMNRKKQ